MLLSSLTAAQGDKPLGKPSMPKANPRVLNQMLLSSLNAAWLLACSVDGVACHIAGTKMLAFQTSDRKHQITAYSNNVESEDKFQASNYST